VWCGPDSVARVTGWDRHQVWLHCRWYRERVGRKFGDAPRGGTYNDELFDAVRRAGYEVECVWRGCRVRYGDFCRAEGRTGRWILHQRNHYFARLPRDTVRHPEAIILAAYRVTKT
jgi:hypothetical protein